MTVAETKAALRRTLLAQRRRRVRTPEQADRLAGSIAAALAHIPGLTGAHPATVIVAAFEPLPDEPDLAPALADLARRGVRIVMPCTHGEGLLWQEHGGGAEPGPLPAVAALLIPAVAVSRAGDRLGRGGGHYDRTLAGLPRWAEGGPLRVACVDEWDVLQRLPRATHDEPVDAIATEQALHWAAG